MGIRRGERNAVGTLDHSVDDVTEPEAAQPASSPAPAPAAAVVAAPTSSEEVDALVARVKERGFVTTGEIFAALPDLEPETAELAAIYEGMERNGIQVVDEIREELAREDEKRAGRGASAPSTTVTDAVDTATELSRALPATRPGAAAGPSAEEPAPVTVPRTRAPRTLSGDMGSSADPVRMYLKEIGKVPLLTGPQEVSLAKRIEAGLGAVDQIEEKPDLSDSQRASL